ncbi:AraC family transcriptional regulator [Streptomyces sp. ISL-100]|uniref:helix-turn-helix domain-containing protein n=1 Tax=Streptomyces sp. ISL-100 TaxID=2819173 RepID=UPI001BEB9C7C|nr:AraC family transcriptional regulator [Streptomyces sp. ISL-100]MBT2398851.1 helix-turn-helix transcriptional regulator [Streptomyces sp. ISL-100]
MYAERASRLDGAVVWTRTVPTPASAAPGPVHPILPDGCMDLMWTNGKLYVAGPDTHAHPPGDTPAGAAARYDGVRFAPGAGPALLGVPAHELRDQRVDLADLWPAARVRALTGRVSGAADPAAALEALVLRHAADVPAPDPVLRAVARQLDAGRTVAATADAAGLGARQLHRRSLTAFGYGPKTLARILRLQRALALVRQGLPYADAALAAGCADQAHLSREMRDLAGTTLGAYAASANRETPQPSGSSATA